jgi:hypothetical protein
MKFQLELRLARPLTEIFIPDPIGNIIFITFFLHHTLNHLQFLSFFLYQPEGFQTLLCQH